MKYLSIYSYQNPEFPKLKEIFQKYSNRYFIQGGGFLVKGTINIVGEFDDKVADGILSHFKKVSELTDTLDEENGFVRIPWSEKFERYANGYQLDYFKVEFHDNKKN